MRHLALALALTIAVAGCAGPALRAAPIGPAGGVATVSGGPAGGSPSPTPAAAAVPSLARLIGQKLVVRMDGPLPGASLLARIRAGEVGGVIVFGANVTTPAALVALLATLRDAAAGGGQPTLLVAVDQEGGPVKRIPWAPPTLSAPAMGRAGSASIARDQGARTGRALRSLGINVDFAPVADVPASTRSFMYRAGRTFSFRARQVSILANAFAAGLRSGGVIPALKHFPGLGYAVRDTDGHVVTIRRSASTLDPGLRPYRAAIARDSPLIMLSNATYPAWDALNAAGWSRAISIRLLRHDLGFTGATITDSLSGIARARGVPVASLATLAAAAGTDLLLLTGDEASTAAVYRKLLRDAAAGRIPVARLRASYRRILALKASLASP